MKFSKYFTFDFCIYERVGKSFSGEKIERAILEYLKNPDEDFKNEIKKLPLTHFFVNTHFSMNKSTFEQLQKIAGGKKCMSTIIALAIWKCYKND